MSDPSTGLLYLSRADVEAAAGAGSAVYVDAVNGALALHARSQTVQPLKPYLRWRPDGHIADRIIAMPAYIGGGRALGGGKGVGPPADHPPPGGAGRGPAPRLVPHPHTPPPPPL